MDHLHYYYFEGLLRQWQLFIYQKRIIRYTVKRACALIRIFITHKTMAFTARYHGIVPLTTAWSRISIHDYHKNLAQEPQNGEYLYSSRMWEQIRQRSPPLLSLSTTDKQTTSQEMAASDREKECSSGPKQPCVQHALQQITHA